MEPHGRRGGQMSVCDGMRLWCRPGVRGGAALILAAAAAMTSGGAIAQQAAQATANTSEVLGEIVVTAQKRTEKLQEVPTSVSVVTSEAISQSNALTMEGLLNEIPGLS